MTLNDFILLLRHYLKWVIIVPVLCALLGGTFVVVRDASKEASYSASASLSVVDITDSLSATNLTLLLSSVAQNAIISLEDDGVAVKVAVDDKAQSVKFTATASGAGEAEHAANSAASATMELMKEKLAEQANVFRDEGASSTDLGSPSQEAVSSKAAALDACIYTVAPATAALNTAPTSVVKYAVFGFIGGLIAVVFVLVMIDSVKCPIKTRRDVEEATNHPIVNGCGGVSGVELARANVLTALGGVPPKLCVISGNEQGQAFSQQLASLFKASGDSTEVLFVSPLSSNAAGYFEVQNADATLVCVARWKDSAKSLMLSLEELELARANVIGIALI